MFKKNLELIWFDISDFQAPTNFMFAQIMQLCKTEV